MVAAILFTAFVHLVYLCYIPTILAIFHLKKCCNVEIGSIIIRAMASKCVSERKRRTSLTLNQKLEMIMLSEKGMSNAEIARNLGLIRQTVSQVVNAKEKFLKEIKSATPMNTRVIRKRDSLIADMEKVLVVWIEDQTSQNIPLSQGQIQSMALTLFNSMKADRGIEAAEEKFEASRGWFMRFKERSCLHNIKMRGKTVSTCIEAVASYPEEFAKIIDEGGYTKQQIFSVDETILHWKKMPTRTFVAKEEKSVPVIRAENDKLTLLLGANAAGDFRLKPMLIDHSKSPRALKNHAKSTLPVFYTWNNNARMTADLFTTWFTEYFKPAVEAYCSEKKIPFKILLIIDNAPPHPRAVMEIYDEINVVFLPSNASFLRPMYQGVISSFKSYYLRQTLRKAVAAVDSDSSDGSKPSKLETFWKGFTILDAIKNIRDSWEEVTVSTLTGIWKKLIPTLVVDFEGFETSLEEVTADVVEMARELELEVNPEDVAELLVSHDKALMDEKFLLMDEQKKSLPEMESAPGEEHMNIVEMTTKDLEYYIGLTDTVAAGFERIDPNFERSSTVSKMLSNSIACYREILHERKRQLMRQTSLLSHFKDFTQTPQLLADSTMTSEQPSTSSSSPPAKRLHLADSSDDED